MKSVKKNNRVKLKIIFSVVVVNLNLTASWSTLKSMTIKTAISRIVVICIPDIVSARVLKIPTGTNIPIIMMGKRITSEMLLNCKKV